MICPFLKNDNSTENKILKTYFKTNVDKASLSLTYAKAYVGTTGNTSCTVNRIGIYTLGEILELYPDLKTRNWQITDTYELKNGNSTITSSTTNDGSTNGEIATNSAAITTIAGCKLFCKAVDFANLPDNYRYFWFRYLQPTEATTEDLFEGMNENAVLMLSFGSYETKNEVTTLKNPYVLPKLPTMHKRLIDFDRNMYNYTFVDGENPANAIKVDVKGSQTTNYATYSRRLVAGYNSCAMPFKKLAHTDDVPEGITFYKVAEINSNGVVSFTKLSDSDLTAATAFTNGTDWTPVIIKAEKAGVYTFVGRDGIANLSGYKSKTVGGSNNQVFWVGSFVNEAPMASGKDYASYAACYGITSNGASFAKMSSDTKTTYYRAFLADNRGSNARALTLSFGDEATGISSIKADKGDNSYYNLSGQRVENPTKGLYIVNGKKVVIK